MFRGTMASLSNARTPATRLTPSCLVTTAMTSTFTRVVMSTSLLVTLQMAVLNFYRAWTMNVHLMVLQLSMMKPSVEVSRITPSRPGPLWARNCRVVPRLLSGAGTPLLCLGTLSWTKYLTVVVLVNVVMEMVTTGWTLKNEHVVFLRKSGTSVSIRRIRSITVVSAPSAVLLHRCSTRGSVDLMAGALKTLSSDSVIRTMFMVTTSNLVVEN